MISTKKDILWRIYIMYFVVVLMAGAILVRIFTIQYIEDDKWEKMAKNQSIKEQKIASNRGNIYSTNNNLLATSIPLFNLYWDSKVVKADTFYNNIDELARQFTSLYPDESFNSFKLRMKSAYRNGNSYFRIRRKVEYAELKKIKLMPIFHLSKYKGGLIIEKYNRRKRPYKMLARRTIGTYNSYQQKYNVGLEGAYNNYLRGEDGVRLVQKTSGGWRTLNIYDKTLKDPKNGLDIITSIDINIQDVAENSLYRELKKHGANWGCAILMEVKTGEIKAIVNLSHDTSNNTYYEGYNHAIGTAVTPGSTFKMATLLVALKDKKVKLTDIIHTGNGVISYYGSKMYDAHSGGFGDLSVKEVFEHSSNVGIFKIVLKAFEQTPQKFIDGLYALGINRPLGIEIKGEKAPFIKDTHHKKWSKLSLPWMAIGYELTMTPLQVLTLYNAVANDGVMVKPQFVKEIRKTNKVIKKFEPVILNPEIAPKSVIKEAQSMCEGVVTDGTATLLRNSPYPIGGKTGTAQIYTKGTYNNNSYIASFVGYFPADKPKYSCMVVIYNPRKGIYYASQVAVPVFKDIADKIYATELDIQTDHNTDMQYAIPSSKVGLCNDMAEVYSSLGYDDNRFAALDGKWIYSYGQDSSLAIRERVINENTIPNVKGMNVRDAVYLLEQMGLRVNFMGSGKVINQSIPPKSKAVKGSGIFLTLKH